MTETQRVRFLGNLEVAAGICEGVHRGPRWNDGDFYKWLESASAIVGATKDKKLEGQLDQLIDLIARTQEKDGYIHTDVQISQRTGSPRTFK